MRPDQILHKTMTVKAYIDTHKQRFLDELFTLLRVPSVSADPNYKGDVARAAGLVADFLTNAHADQVEIVSTNGHPIVYGEKIIDKEMPTILIYGHYDVQPPDPIELWHTKPFEPEIREGNIYARGSADDKGQFFMHIKAFEAMMATQNLPCNVKFMIEGEEEVGSNNLESFCIANKEKLACDVILISDTALIANDVPSLTVGLRGLSYVEVEVTGPNRDLHSGVYGGGVTNPVNALCQMISAMHDDNGRITIPGFYDDVEILSMEERIQMNEAPFDIKAYTTDLGIDAVNGEKDYTTIERTSIRPTLDVNGIWGGYTGAGAKTVLPSKATAKISARLVPNQSSRKMTDLLLDYFRKIAPAGVTVRAFEHHGGEPYMTPIESRGYRAASKAVETTFGKAPIPVRGGGSIPICSILEKELGIKIIFMGFGLDNDNLHSPNEKYNIENYYKGIETIPYFHQFFAQG